MKKTITTLLAILFALGTIFSISACGNKTEETFYTKYVKPFDCTISLSGDTENEIWISGFSHEDGNLSSEYSVYYLKKEDIVKVCLEKEGRYYTRYGSEGKNQSKTVYCTAFSENDVYTCSGVIYLACEKYERFLTEYSSADFLNLTIEKFEELCGDSFVAAPTTGITRISIG